MFPQVDDGRGIHREGGIEGVRPPGAVRAGAPERPPVPPRRLPPPRAVLPRPQAGPHPAGTRPRMGLHGMVCFLLKLRGAPHQFRCVHFIVTVKKIFRIIGFISCPFLETSQQ